MYKSDDYSTRPELLKTLADRITLITKSSNKPLLIAVNGKDASGKTVFADNLANFLRGLSKGLDVIRMSFDDYLQVSSVRNGDFKDQGEGSYNNAFDYRALIEHVLIPLTSGSSFSYRRRSIDLETDRVSVSEVRHTTANSIVIIDGLFLFREELDGFWSLKILLVAPVATLMERGVERDKNIYGGIDEARRRYEQRFMPSQDVYWSRADPENKAHIIVDNESTGHPIIVKMT